MARSELHALKDILAPTLIRLARLEAGALGPIWAEAVGPGLAARTRISKLEGGVLVVETLPELMEELRAARALLLDRLEARLGRRMIERIDLVAAWGVAPPCPRGGGKR